jgi:L-rhamnose mutarotase
LGLAKHHPELFERAKTYEKPAENGKSSFTWSQGETLHQLLERAADIEAETAKRAARNTRRTWQEILAEASSEQEDESCLICSL